MYSLFSLQVKKCELSYELKTVGNITFTEVTEDGELKSAFQTLLNSFLCSHTKR